MSPTSSKTNRTMLALAVAAVIAIIALGFRRAFPEPVPERAAINVVDQRIGHVKVDDLYVLAPPGGTPSVRLALDSDPTQPADELTGVTVTLRDGSTVSPSGLPVRLEPGKLVDLAATQSPGLRIPRSADQLPPAGADSQITLTFRSGAQATVDAPVVATQP